MTDQYLPTNINAPRGSKSFVAPTPPVVIQLNLDDDLVVMDTTADPGGLELPDATQIPGLLITIKATNAGSTGNPIGVQTIAGQTIDGAPVVLLTNDEESLSVKSDGSNWRVVGATGAGSTAAVSLDLTYDGLAAASVPPILFTTWAEILAAISLIPGNLATGIPYVTNYRLNMTDGGAGSQPDPGIHDLTNAEFRAARKIDPDGLGFRASGFAGFSIENAASLDGVEGTSPIFSAVSPFSWPSFGGDEPYVNVSDCEFRQPANGAPGPPWMDFPDGGTITMRGRMELGNSSLGCGAVGGETLIVNCYERTRIISGALDGPGNFVLNIFSPATEISFFHFIGGFFEPNIGGAQFDIDTFFTLGETILFSSGGPIDWTVAGPAGEQEIYAGGTNPAGATPPQAAFSLPQRGMYLPKFSYMRGIGIIQPSSTVPGLSYDINVYDAIGSLVLTETFVTGPVTQFADFTFGRFTPNAGGLLRVTITPAVPDAGPVMDDGLIVGIRSA